MTMSVPDYLLLQDLKRRVEALEQTQANCRQSLEQQNGRRRADSERLRSAIAQVLADNSAPNELSAKQVLRALQSMDLRRPELPSVRTVQWHLAQMRNCARTPPPLPEKR